MGPPEGHQGKGCHLRLKCCIVCLNAEKIIYYFYVFVFMSNFILFVLYLNNTLMVYYPKLFK